MTSDRQISIIMLLQQRGLREAVVRSKSAEFRSTCEARLYSVNTYSNEKA